MKMIHSCMVTKSTASQRRDGAAQHEVVKSRGKLFFRKVRSWDTTDNLK